MRAAVYERYGAPEVVRIAGVRRTRHSGAGEVLRAGRRGVGRRGRRAPRASGSPVVRAPVLRAPDARSSRCSAPTSPASSSASEPGVTRFAPGDRVFGAAGAGVRRARRARRGRRGGTSSHACPTGSTHAEAVATLDGFLTALPFLRDGGARAAPGRRVLVNGASGTRGRRRRAAREAPRRDGRRRVQPGATSRSCASLGADRVIDYTREDFTAARDRVRRHLRRGRQAHVPRSAARR